MKDIEQIKRDEIFRGILTIKIDGQPNTHLHSILNEQTVESEEDITENSDISTPERNWLNIGATVMVWVSVLICSSIFGFLAWMVYRGYTTYINP